MIELDGSFGEGGGAIIRNALALSALTRKPFKVGNIRKGRCKPGLMAQHLNAVLAVKEICNAKVEGAKLHSTQLVFYPKEIKAKTLSVDIGTAGSITLLLQALLLPCVFTNNKVRLRLKGGTDTKWSMPYDYFANVFLPHIRFLAEFDVKLLKRGYYPKGGGRIDIKIKPKHKISDFKSFDMFLDVLKEKNQRFDILEPGKIEGVEGISHASNDLQKANVAERQVKGAKQALGKLDCNINIKKEYSDSLCPGSGICLWAVSDNNAIVGADALGERGKRAEIVGKQAGESLLKELKANAPVDSHLADQLIPYLALLGGSYRTTKISKHTTTNIYVAEKFIDVKFGIDEDKKVVSV